MVSKGLALCVTTATRFQIRLPMAQSQGLAHLGQRQNCLSLPMLETRQNLAASWHSPSLTHQSRTLLESMFSNSPDAAVPGGKQRNPQWGVPTNLRPQLSPTSLSLNSFVFLSNFRCTTRVGVILSSYRTNTISRFTAFFHCVDLFLHLVSRTSPTCSSPVGPLLPHLQVTIILNCVFILSLNFNSLPHKYVCLYKIFLRK